MACTPNPPRQAAFDVLIIGGGLVGSAIARELARKRLTIGVLEKNLDVCYETSGRNSGVVHAGFAYDTGTLKARLCIEGNDGMDQLSEWTANIAFAGFTAPKILWMRDNELESFEKISRIMPSTRRIIR